MRQGKRRARFTSTGHQNEKKKGIRRQWPREAGLSKNLNKHSHIKQNFNVHTRMCDMPSPRAGQHSSKRMVDSPS